jgi:hypothetical protein
VNIVGWSMSTGIGGQVVGDDAIVNARLRAQIQYQGRDDANTRNPIATLPVIADGESRSSLRHDAAT